MRKWHVELAISGPAGSIIKGWFVRLSLVFMTSALMSLSRSTRASEDEYMSTQQHRNSISKYLTWIVSGMDVPVDRYKTYS